MGRHPLILATTGYVLIAVALTGPALVGCASLAPDTVLDHDPLYRVAPPPPPPKLGDYTGTVLDYPRDLAFARGLHAGRIDSWNPLAAAGVPLWADNGGPFFPLKAPFYLAPSRETYSLFLALRLVLAAVGAYLLARARGQAPVLAFAAGATFEISGAMLAQLPFGNASAIYLLPWVILGAFLIAQRRTWQSAAAAGIALGISGHGGHPTLILMIFAAFAAAAAGHVAAARRRPRDALSIAGYATLAVALGLAVGAASLLPLAELTGAGNAYKYRPIGQSIRLRSSVSARGVFSASLFASRPLGTLPAVHTLADVSSAIGTIALFVATTGAFRGRLSLPLVAVALLGIGLALAPLGLDAATLLPGLHLILPMYAWPLIALPATQAVGDGLAAFAEANGWRAAVPALALIAATQIALPPPTIESPLPPMVPRLPGVGTEVPLTTWFLPSVTAAGVLVTSVLFRRAGLGTVGAAGLAALMIGEQLWTVIPLVLQPVSGVPSRPPSPVVGFLQDRLSTDAARFAGIPYTVGYPQSPMLFGLSDLRGISGLPISRYYDYIQALNVRPFHFSVQSVPERRTPLLDLAAVRYLALPAPAPANPSSTATHRRARPWPGDDPILPRVYADERVVVHENLAALPVVRIAHRAVRVPDASAARSWAQALGRSAETARALGLDDIVVLEPDEQGNEAPGLSGARTEFETVRLVDQEDPDRVVIEAQLDTAGFVVLAHTYYPGWTAWVDGSRTPIYPAYLLFRAVYVPAGAHVVEMRYQPDSLLYGGSASGLALLVCCIALLRSGHVLAAIVPARHRGPPRRSL